MNNELNREINLKSILAFTLPSIFMMVVMSLYTIVDGIFVSRLINTNAFSAVNIIYPLMSIVIGLGTMFGTGTTAIVSRKLGEGRQKEANQIVTFIILFTIGLGIAFSVVSCLFLGDIIHLLAPMTPFLTIAANMRCRLFCFCPSAFCRCSSRAFLSPTENRVQGFW